jgi:hypothetical protein
MNGLKRHRAASLGKASFPAGERQQTFKNGMAFPTYEIFEALQSCMTILSSVSAKTLNYSKS